jgi:hypothetical protein
MHPSSGRWWLVLSALVLVSASAACGQPAAVPRQSHTSPPLKVLFATLDGVSCPAGGHCTAVGHVLPFDKDVATGDPDGDGQVTRTLVAESDGNRWRTEPSPNQGRGGDSLSSVSCPSGTHCFAVGSYRAAPFPLAATAAPPDAPLIEQWSAGRWQIMDGPPVASNSVLTGISCPSTADCTAIGYSTIGNGPANPTESFFVEHYDGTSWSRAALAPAPGTSGQLKAIDCPAIGSCVAVGAVAPSSDPTHSAPLVERLSRGAWRVDPLSRTGVTMGTLEDVACRSVNDCTAVGNAVTGPRSGSALVLSFDGSTWHVSPAALAQPGDVSLTAVGCPGTASCFVAGIALESALRVLARVADSGWSSLAGYSQNATLNAVACPPAGTTCVTVGSAYVNGYGNTTTLIATLSGTGLTDDRSGAV